MKELHLTTDQQRRIDAIKKEWLDELKRITEAPLTHWPDISYNKPYRELELKYRPMLDAIIAEGNDE